MERQNHQHGTNALCHPPATSGGVKSITEHFLVHDTWQYTLALIGLQRNHLVLVPHPLQGCLGGVPAGGWGWEILSCQCASGFLPRMVPNQTIEDHSGMMNSFPSTARIKNVNCFGPCASVRACVRMCWVGHHHPLPLAAFCFRWLRIIGPNSLHQAMIFLASRLPLMKAPCTV